MHCHYFTTRLPRMVGWKSQVIWYVPGDLGAVIVTLFR